MLFKVLHRAATRLPSVLLAAKVLHRAATRLPSVLLAAKVLSQADPYSIAPLTDNLGHSEWVFGQEREGIATRVHV